VSGIVVDRTGAPVAGATVMLRSDPRNGVGIWPGGQGRSDAEGNFVIGGVTPGSYMVMASVPIRSGRQGTPGSGVGAYSIDILRPSPSPSSTVTVTDGNVDGVQVVVQLLSQ
jgi:hypothetical protein